MRGVFVSNAYLRGGKFSEPGRMLSAAAEELDVTLDLVTNADLRIPIGDRAAAERALGDADFVLFWDKDVRLAANLEVCGFPVFNSAQCISVCDDKCLTHLVLANESMSVVFGTYATYVIMSIMMMVMIIMWAAPSSARPASPGPAISPWPWASPWPSECSSAITPPIRPHDWTPLRLCGTSEPGVYILFF